MSWPRITAGAAPTLAGNLARFGRLAAVLASLAGAIAPAAAAPPHAGRAEAPPGIEARAAKVGAPAPPLSLPAADGSRWSLADALARGPAVLVFYRGDW
jgi:hypothetical protein